jgi:hypothetical protein
MKVINYILIGLALLFAWILLRNKAVSQNPNNSNQPFTTPPNSSGINTNQGFLGAKYNSSNPINALNSLAAQAGALVGIPPSVTNAVKNFTTGIGQKIAKIFPSNTMAHHFINWINGG